MLFLFDDVKTNYLEMVYLAHKQYVIDDIYKTHRNHKNL